MEDLRSRALASSLWSQLPPELAEAVFANAMVAPLPAGFIIDAAQGTNRIGLVLDGVIAMHVTSKGGRRAIVHYARTGEMLGLTSLLSGPCHMGCQALTDSVLLVITGDELREHALRDARIAWALAEEQGRRTFDMLEELTGNTFGSVRQRVARHLLDLAVDDSHDQLVAPISQQELANAVGTVREVVSRVLTALRAEGVVRVTPAGVEVLDATALYEQSTAA